MFYLGQGIFLNNFSATLEVAVVKFYSLLGGIKCNSIGELEYVELSAYYFNGVNRRGQTSTYRY